MSMYGMTNYGKFFSGELTQWLLEAIFIQYQCHMSIYYKHAPCGTNVVALSYVYECAYWYTYEALGKQFMGTLENIFPVDFLGYSH